MLCAVVEVRVDFDFDLILPTPLDALRSALARAGDVVSAPAGSPPLLTPIHLRVAEKRLGTLVSSRSWTVRSERLADQTSMLADVLAQFTQAADFYREVPAQAVKVISHWIEPLDTNWDDLLKDYIRAFYRAGTLRDDASDATIVFDATGEYGNEQYQSGPMSKKQLADDYLRFWNVDDPALPDLLLFVGHVASVPDSGPIDATAIGEVARGALGRAAAFAEDHFARFSEGSTGTGGAQ